MSGGINEKNWISVFLFRYMETHLHFQRLQSTNTYLIDLVDKNAGFLFPSYFAVTADEQELGRGQQGKKWESESGKNLLVSLLLYPDIQAKKQFTICQYVSIAIADFIKENCSISNVYIKWPNDIYINHKKVAGILIKHFIRGEFINYTIVGIGLNINQIIFSPSLPNATSLCIETGKEYNSIACMKSLIEKIKQTEKLPENKLKTRYLSYLYKKDDFSYFIIPKISDKPISLMIKGVNKFGLLELLDKNNNLHCYAFNEVVYVVNNPLHL
jgi:BirA family biotin operon repressor/biotin-[acetyl-CoA-carboxylase] ligase